MNLTAQAHLLLGEFLKGIPRPCAIDATCGNGRDTLALARLGCRVFAFDIQAAAVNETLRLAAKGGVSEMVSAFVHSHADMASKIPDEFRGKINAAVFNLGWLPGSDKNVITRPGTTLEALESLHGLLAPRRNMVSLLAYRGHEGGSEDFEAAEAFAMRRAPKIFGDISNPKSPVLFVFSL